MGEIICPHCKKEITGPKKIMIEMTLNNPEAVDAKVTCPNCAAKISKKDMK